jgi:hypothetical protein
LPPEEQAELRENIEAARRRWATACEAALVAKEMHETAVRECWALLDELKDAEVFARRFGVMSDEARDEMKLNLSEERYV